MQKIVFIGLDGETDTIMAVGFSKESVLHDLRVLDVYFKTYEEFDEFWDGRYRIEIWAVKNI